MAQRTPAEIRDSIESNRMELAVSVQQLRGEVERLTDWQQYGRKPGAEADDITYCSRPTSTNTT